MTRTPIALSILAGIMLVGCQQAPVEQVSAIQEDLENARDAEAEKYAPETFAAAQDNFNKATQEITVQEEKFALTRNYAQAEQLLQESLGQLKTAQTEAIANKAAVKAEVESLTEETDVAIAAAQESLAKAPRGKDTQVELEAMKADLDTASTALAEARGLYAAGDYLAAKASLTQTKQKAEGISSEVEAAALKLVAARRPAAR